MALVSRYRINLPSGLSAQLAHSCGLEVINRHHLDLPRDSWRVPVEGWGGGISGLASTTNQILLSKDTFVYESVD